MLSDDAISKFKMVLNLQMRGRLENASRAQTCSFRNIWYDDFKHCINWSCYREQVNK